MSPSRPGDAAGAGPRRWFVAGLGNPGRRYRRTRHNVGFRVVERIAGHVDWSLKKFGALVERTAPGGGGKTVFLLKPQLYMNRSGPPVRDVLRYYGAGAEALLVVHDDLDLPPGTLRFRRHGSAGGHRGIASIIEALGTPAFSRLKVGIGREDEVDSSEYVLQRPCGEQEEAIEKAEERAAGAVEDWVRYGIDWCMNRYNGQESPPADEPASDPGARPGT